MRIAVYFLINMVLSILSGIALLEDKIIIFFLLIIIIISGIFKDSIPIKIRIMAIFIGVFSFLNVTSYYNDSHKIEFVSQDFRVESKTSRDLILKSKSINSKRYVLRNYKNIDSLEEGIIINLDGEFERNNFYDKGIVGEINNIKINNVKSDFLHKLVKLKNYVKDKFIMVFGEERGNVLSGITFGDYGDLSKDYKENLKNLGIVHILSVSGFHMNIVFMILSKFLNMFSSMSITFFYLIFTGFKLSGIRAFTMLLLRESAPRLYRTYDGINCLCLSAVIIFLFKPYEIFNLGFIYSFFSTLGILMFNRKISDYLYRIPKIIADMVSIIISAQIFIIPINIIVERKINIGFLLPNILLVPFYSFLMILGIIYIFFMWIPFLEFILKYIITLLFSILDGGKIILNILASDTIYLNNYLIIFIFCLYLIYFISKVVHFDKIKFLPLFIFALYFMFTNTINVSFEYGKYYDNRYVILRNSRGKEIMYLDNNVRNDDVLKEKFDVDMVYGNIDSRNITFYNEDIFIDFRQDDKIIVEFNDKEKFIDIYDYQNKYYSYIYPQGYYVIF